jgi:alpha-L-fucosidase
MNTNKECIFGTRPWKVFGEGPSAENQLKTVGNFNEGKVKPFTADDIRFTTRDGAVYAIILGKPDKNIVIKSLGSAAGLFDRSIGKVELSGSDQALQWTQNADALTIKLPTGDLSTTAVVFKVSGK